MNTRRKLYALTITTALAGVLVLLWSLGIQRIPCAVTVVLVASGTMLDYRKEPGLWMYSPILLLSHLVLVAFLLNVPWTNAHSNFGFASLIDWIDWIVASVLGLFGIVYTLRTAVINANYSMTRTISVSPVVVDRGDIKPDHT